MAEADYFLRRVFIDRRERVKLYDFIDNYRILSLEQVHVLRNVQGNPFVYRFAEAIKVDIDAVRTIVDEIQEAT